MNLERSVQSKVVGYLNYLLRRHPPETKLRVLTSPLTLVICQLFASGFYFSDLKYWWFYVLGVQVIFCIIGIFVPNWRFFSVLIFLILLFQNISDFSSLQWLPGICNNQIDTITGTIKTDSHDTTDRFDLIKCTIWCNGKGISKPLVRIESIPSKSGYTRKFQPGDLLELKNLQIVNETLFGLEAHPLDNFRYYNLSYQKKILSRHPILVFIQSKANYYLEGFTLSVFKSLLTADRSDLGASWRNIFRNLGVIHIFAISGMHIGILFLWLTFIIRKLISFPKLSILKGYGVVFNDFLSLAVIFLFLSMIGMPISAKRAVFMLAWWMLVKHLLGWQPIWFILFGVALLILLTDPAAIGQVSFQLSFVSVVGILLILPVLPIRRSADSWRMKTLKNLLSIFIISCWLQLFSLPIVANLTQFQSLLAPTNNLIHITFISFIFLPMLLIALLANVFYFYLNVSFGEFLLYSTVNFVSKFWEYLLVVNHHINSLFLISVPTRWNFFFMLLYWFVLIILSVFIRYLLLKKRSLR